MDQVLGYWELYVVSSLSQRIFILPHLFYSGHNWGTVQTRIHMPIDDWRDEMSTLPIHEDHMESPKIFIYLVWDS